MKKLSSKQILRDKRRVLLERRKTSKERIRQSKELKEIALEVNNWVKRRIKEGLNIKFLTKRDVAICLPERMNFSSDYESTALYIQAIRRLASRSKVNRKQLKLVSVDFSKLKKMSTSAGLALTAELSKWDDSISKRLKPVTDNWDPEIVNRFRELGFFDLFSSSDEENQISLPPQEADLSIVKYIKSRCKGSSQTRLLRSELQRITGKEIDKWTFLRSGLNEAITNVGQHAYPPTYKFREVDKNWYLTGSYRRSTRVLKIIFYDQGIGIPNSLPASELWEKVYQFMSELSVDVGLRKRDERLLKAAVEVERTRTGKSDRGKGLPDMLEFVRKRGEGYLSILSLRGLYKFSIENGKEKVKTVSFDNRLYGTLIIWQTTL